MATSALHAGVAHCPPCSHVAGIGYAIVKQIAARGPSVRTVLAARNVERGQEALAKLQSELGPDAGPVVFRQVR